MNDQLNNPASIAGPVQQDNSNLIKDRKQRGTGFANIGKILNANQGVGQKIGNAIGSNLAGQAQSVKQGIEQGQSQFQAGLNQSKSAADTNIGAASNFANDIAGGGAGGVDDAGAAKIAENLKNTGYNGPTGLSNAQNLTNQSAQAAALNRLGGNAGGQQQLIRSMVAKRGNYNQGQAGLDTALVGQGGQQAIQQGRQQLNGLTDASNSAITGATSLANATKAGIDNQKADVGSKITTLNNDINTAATNQAKDFQTKVGRLSALASGSVDPSTITPEDRDLLAHASDYGLDLNQQTYGSPEEVQAAMAKAATANTNFGAQMFKDKQQAALANLAAFQGKSPEEIQKIKDMTFDKQAFKTPASEAYAAMNANYAKDQGIRNTLLGAGQAVAQKEKAARDANDAKRQQLLGQIKNMKIGDTIPGVFGNTTIQSQDDINNYARQMEQEYNANQNRIINKGTPTAGTNLFGFNGAVQGDEASNAPYGGDKGFLLYGDRGDNSIAPEYQGLGLGVQQGVGSGQYRSSTQLMSAADKAMKGGAQKTALQRLLEKYGQGAK